MIAKTQRIRIGAGLMLCLSLLCLSAPAASAQQDRSTLSVQVVLLPSCEVSARGGQAEVRCTGGEEAAATTIARSPSSPLALAEHALVKAREDVAEPGTTWVTVSY